MESRVLLIFVTCCTTELHLQPSSDLLKPLHALCFTYSKCFNMLTKLYKHHDNLGAKPANQTLAHASSHTFNKSSVCFLLLWVCLLWTICHCWLFETESLVVLEVLIPECGWQLQAYTSMPTLFCCCLSDILFSVSVWVPTHSMCPACVPGPVKVRRGC